MYFEKKCHEYTKRCKKETQMVHTAVNDIVIDRKLANKELLLYTKQGIKVNRLRDAQIWGTGFEHTANGQAIHTSLRGTAEQN